jgi:MFS family permease
MSDTNHAASAAAIQGQPAGKLRSLPQTVAALTLANIMIYVAYMGILIVLLPLQVQSVDAAQKVANLALVTGAGAIFAAVCNPVAGALSDRTRSRFGRRTPWLLGAAICSAAALSVLGQANTVVTITIMFCIVQGSLNSFHAPLMAAMPERIPEDRRGTASAFIGLNVPLGSMIGTAIASYFAARVANGYIAIGVLLVVVALVFVKWSPDTPYMRDKVGVASPEIKWSTFFSAFKHSDFAWTFISRAAMILGYFLVVGYQLYLLQDYIQLPEGVSAPSVLVTVTTVMTVGMIGATVVGGWLSDMFQRRKIFMLIASIGAAIGLLIPLAFPTMYGMYGFAIVMGMGFGCYLAVDAALITQVLPSDETAGRDLGVLNIASAGPQIASPFVAALIIQHAGGYASLFIAGAVIMAISGLSILGVRGVR